MFNLQGLQMLQNLQGRGGGLAPFNPLSIDSITQWLFNQANTATQAVDKVGVRDGEVFAGRCYDFDGVNDQIVDIPIITSQQYDHITIRVQAYITTNSTRQIFTCREDNNTRLGIMQQGTRIVATHRVGGTYTSQEFTVSGAGFFDIVAAFISDGTIRLWVDGVEAATAGTRTVTATINGACISGEPGNASTRPFDGKLFSLAVWGEGSSGQTYTPTTLPTSGYTLFYKMDEGGGIKASDSSGNRDHGNIKNIAATTFFVEDVNDPYSYLNQVGYSDGEFYNGTTAYTDTQIPNQTLNRVKFFYLSTQTSGIRHIVSGYNAVGLGSIGIGGVNIDFEANNGSVFTSSTDVADGQWHEIDIDLANAAMTIDGASQVLSAGTMSTPQNSTIWVGGRESGGVLSNPDQFSISGLEIYDASDNLIDLSNAIKTDVAAITIPRNEAIPTQDVLGNPLQYVGRVRLNANFKQSNCANFDGVNDHGTCVFDFSPVSRYEIEMSVELVDSGSGQQRIFDNRTATNNGVSIYLQNGTLKLEHNGVQINSTNIFGVQAKIRASWDGSEISLHIDDVLHNTASVSTSVSKSRFEIGSRSLASTGQHIQGKVYGLSIKVDDAKTTFPLAEGKGTTSYAHGDRTKQIIWESITDSTFWAKQDSYHYNIIAGFSEGVNKFERSEDLTDTYWGSFRSTRTLASAVENIQLTNIEATETNISGSSVFKNVGLVEQGVYTFSVYAQASDSDFLQLRPSDNAVFNDRANAWFDLTNGTVTSVSAPGTSFDSASASIEEIGNGLYRCSLTFTTNTDISNFSARYYVIDADGSNAVTIGASINIGGAQLEEGELADYQITDSSPTAGSKLPYQINGAYTNPAVENGHNGAETGRQVPKAPSLYACDVSNFLFDASGEPNTIFYADHVENVGNANKLMMDISVANQHKNFLAFNTALSGINLTKVEKYLNQ